jgi:hypothetical protein
MNDGVVAEDPIGGFAWLLWPMAFAVAWLAVQVGLGYLRQAGRAATPRQRRAFVGAAAAAFGLGLWAAALLGISGTPISVDIGYGVRELATTGAICLMAGLGAALLLARWHRPVAVVAAGALLGAGTLLGAVGCVFALGLQPGPQFNQQREALALAWPLAASGSIAGFWIALLAGGRAGARRRLWRWVASTLVALAVVACQALAIGAADLEAQTGSLHSAEIPLSAAGLAAGIGLPTLLLAALLDLGMRRLAPANTPIAPRKRRRQRRGRPLA